MDTSPSTGYLVIADLTGYTSYLASSEIEHAPIIAGDLLETIVGRLEPPFRLSKFEGDAAFAYVEDGRADPSLLFDAIEASYIAFRRRLRSIEQATSCDCSSCRLAPRLDLKFFVHHGRFVTRVIAGREELAGSDVILVHRLLKVTTAAPTAPVGFALFTDAAVTALHLDGEAMGLVAGRERIEHLGDVDTWTMDLEARWQIESEARRIDTGSGQPIVDLTATVTAGSATVWAYLTSPTLRTTWEGPIAISETSASGRRGIGTVATCVTGRLATIEEIVDWQPYDHAAWRLAVPGIGPVLATCDLDALADRTTVRIRWSRPDDDADAPADVLARLREDRTAAFGRLIRSVNGALPVIDPQEVQA
jgi:hypothetical protein